MIKQIQVSNAFLLSRHMTSVCITRVGTLLHKANYGFIQITILAL
jgi:hypothetical protein